MIQAQTGALLVIRVSRPVPSAIAQCCQFNQNPDGLEGSQSADR
jgi:hypothetical protein